MFQYFVKTVKRFVVIPSLHDSFDILYFLRTKPRAEILARHHTQYKMCDFRQISGYSETVHCRATVTIEHRSKTIVRGSSDHVVACDDLDGP